MRFNFNKWVVIGAVLVLPQIVFGSPGSDALTSTGTKTPIEFDPSKNSLGLDGSTVTDSTGSIKALTYLTGADDPVTIAIRLINLALSFLGTISLILMLYAGFVWFKARDNEEEVKKAKQIIIGSVTGLAITLGAYSIAYLLFALRGAV